MKKLLFLSFLLVGAHKILGSEGVEPDKKRQRTEKDQQAAHTILSLMNFPDQVAVAEDTKRKFLPGPPPLITSEEYWRLLEREQLLQQQLLEREQLLQQQLLEREQLLQQLLLEREQLLQKQLLEREQLQLLLQQSALPNSASEMPTEKPHDKSSEKN